VIVAVAADTTDVVLGFGARSPEDPRAPDENTAFGIGSLTKVITGVALADAVVHGRMSLQDDAQRFLPEVPLPHYADRSIRLVHLATYSSGLPWMPTNWVERDKGPYSDAMWHDFLAAYALPHAPGEGFEYGNVGFGMLGAALAAQEQRPLGELLRARVFGRLGMQHSWFFNERPQGADVAHGYDDNGSPVPLRSDRPFFPACCALESTAHDLLTFLRAHWDASTPADMRQSLELALTPRRKGEGSYAAQDVGLGWFMADGLATKSGLMKGFRTGIALDRAKRRAAVVLAADARFPSERLAVEALRALAVERAADP